MKTPKNVELAYLLRNEKRLLRELQKVHKVLEQLRYERLRIAKYGM
jgi:hypothetical protein